MPIQWHLAILFGIAVYVGHMPAAAALDEATAIRKALAADPRLVAGGLEAEAARGEVVQAGRRPNPEASVELENFGGSGDFGGFGNSEVTVGVQQKFERGGKRSARLEAARGQEDVANAQIAILRREIVAQTKIDFGHVMGARAKVRVLSRAAVQLQALVPKLERRVSAGGAFRADLARGRLAAGRAQVALDKARVDLKTAKRQLVSNWGGHVREAEIIEGRLHQDGGQVLGVNSLMPLIDRHPAILSWDAVWAARAGNVSVQQSLAVPDVTLGAGVRRFSERDDVAFLITGAISLPVHDRNEGNIAASSARLEAVQFERAAARRTLRRRLISVHGEMEAECLEARRLADVVVPQGRGAAKDIQNGFEQGRLSVKDLLDGYSAALETEQELIEADTRCHAAAAKVETLTGRRPWQSGWEPVVEGFE